jgi:hypothetical protein
MREGVPPEPEGENACFSSLNASSGCDLDDAPLGMSVR